MFISLIEVELVLGMEDEMFVVSFFFLVLSSSDDVEVSGMPVFEVLIVKGEISSR